MKKCRKILSLMIVLVLAMSLSITALAAGEGKITINDAVEGVSYSVYRILDLESYDETTNAYSYTPNEDWEEWLEEQTEYVTIENGYVTWVEGADAQAFAQAALAYAQNTPIAPIQTKSEPGDAPDLNNETVTVTFEGLDLGYYLVDSSLGVLCSLDTTDNEVEIEEKNEVPEASKTVEGDNGDSAASNTAMIGETVDYEVNITVKKGAQGYVLHDNMAAGLTFNQTSVKIQVAGTDVPDTYYTLNVADDTTCEQDCDFEIVFTDTYLESIAPKLPETDGTDPESVTITVSYSATLNENAVVGDAGNVNTARLEYGQDPDGEQGDGEKPSTPDTTATTYTYRFNMVKTDGDNKVLDGAEFELYDAQTEGNKINLVYDETGKRYRVATEEEVNAQGFTSAVIEAGTATIEGLANGTYYLEETVAPDGYNKLSGRQPVTINDRDLTTGKTVNGENYGVEVVNKTGSLLPSTGGIGTAIFYIVGGALVLVAVVLLVTKKRMKDE